MGQGLGKNSPVQLNLGKENYEALISRHGQWVRWRVASKCPCVRSDTQQPDIHCEKCGGTGITFGYQKKAIVSQTVMIRDNSGIIEIDNLYSDCELLKCYDNSGVRYDNATKTGNFVMLNTATLPVKGVYVTVVLSQDVLKSITKAECKSLGNGFYKVEGLTVSRTNIDGLYHTAPGDIESIESVFDDEGNVFEVLEKRLDTFFVKPIEKEIIEEGSEDIKIEIINPPATLYAKNLKYIPPFTFVILSQNLSKSDFEAVDKENGDAMLSFPYSYDVADDDVITVLSGTYTQKTVLTKTSVDYDTLPAYFVDDVVSCIGAEREYISGVDFALCGTNYIKWLCLDCPEDGEAYTITYRVLPTYKVVKNIPQLRTSENQRMPKKAIIKLYSSYGEKRGVNRV